MSVLKLSLLTKSSSVKSFCRNPNMRKELNISENFIAEITKNWQSCDLIVISSRPGMGKTNFLLSLFQNETFQRVSSEFISLNYDNICPNSEGEDRNSIGKQTENPTVSFMNIGDILNYLQDLSKNKGIKYVFIDNIELIGDNISDILLQLKTAAKELSIIIITTIPLDKACKSEHTKPTLAALKRKIPLIERIADFIFLIHRPIYYSLRPTDASLALIIIAKNKGGETGYFPVCLNKKSHLFEDFDLSKITG